LLVQLLRFLARSALVTNMAIVGHGPGAVHVSGLLAPLIFAGAVGNTVGPDIYTFGGHAGALYNAEAAKTTFFAPAIAGAKPENPSIQFVTGRPQDTPNQVPSWYQRSTVFGLSSSPPIPYAYARPQDDPNQVRTQSFTWAASAASYTLLGKFVYGVPQTDPSQPPAQIQVALRGEGLPSDPVPIGFIQAGPQPDLTPPSQFRPAIPNPPIVSGRLTARQLVVPAQTDPSQMQPQWFAIEPQVLSNTGVGGDVYQFGIHAAALYNAEAQKSQFWPPIVQGPSQSPVVASEYLFGTHAAVLYNAEAEKTQVWEPAASSAILPGAIPGAEYLFGAHAVATYNAEAVKTTFFWSASANPQGTIVPWIEAEPQSWRYDVDGQDFRSALQQTVAPYVLQTLFATPQLVDLTVQPQIHGPTFTTPPTPFSPARMYAAGPPQNQVVTTQLPAQIWHPPMAVPPSIVTLKTIFAGPQTFDLTLQPVVTQKSIAPPLPGIVPLETFFVGPQSLDFSAYFQPQFFRPGVTPFIPGIQLTVPNWGGRVVLSPKKLGEDVLIPMDFISRLGVGETIIGASAAISVYSGTDPNVGTMLQGSPSVIQTVVEQFVSNGVIGVIYELLYTVNTSANQRLSLSGYFAVEPDLP
jgi:hypothetical protein